MRVPQTDPGAGYRKRREAVLRAVAEVLDGGWYVIGECVRAFEEAFASWLGGGRAVGVASGTDALTLALRAAGIGPGDKVAVPALTAVATVAAVRLAGGTPVVVDVDDETLCLCPSALEEVLGRVRGVRAVVPVHLHGGMADMPQILDVARRHGAEVVEDCAQAHGAAREGRPAGRWGRFGCFSFYPTKNLGALGDGGMIVCRDEKDAARVKRLRQYGWDGDRISREEGWNSRLDELQAAVLLVRLAGLDEDNRKRRRIADLYRERLKATPGVRLPVEPEGVCHVYHQFAVRCLNRDHVRQRLAEAGVGTAVHYPRAVHQEPGYAAACEVPLAPAQAERAAGELLSLPMYPELSDEAALRAADCLVRAVAEEGGDGRGGR